LKERQCGEKVAAVGPHQGGMAPRGKGKNNLPTVLAKERVPEGGGETHGGARAKNKTKKKGSRQAHGA